jgi:hypothetical protein
MLCSEARERSKEVGITGERGWCSDRSDEPHASLRSRAYWFQDDREQIMQRRSDGVKNVQTKWMSITGLGVSWVQLRALDGVPNPQIRRRNGCQGRVNQRGPTTLPRAKTWVLAALVWSSTMMSLAVRKPLTSTYTQTSANVGGNRYHWKSVEPGQVKQRCRGGK